MDDNAAHLPPSLEQANAYHDARGAAIEKQQLETIRYDDQRETRMREVHKDKIDKKRGEREKAREVLAKLAGAQVEGNVMEIFVPDLPEGERTTGPPPSLLPTASTSRPLNTVSYLVTIKLSSKKEPWYDPASATYSELEAAGAAGLWNYPTTPLQAARCKVFEDLWRKGHFMGGGLRFGGDFLVYPGSSPLPSFRHVSMLNQVCRGPTEVSLALYPHSSQQSNLHHPPPRSHSVRSTRHSSQEGSPARKLEREGGKGRLLLTGMGCVRLIHREGRGIEINQSRILRILHASQAYRTALVK